MSYIGGMSMLLTLCDQGIIQCGGIDDVWTIYERHRFTQRYVQLILELTSIIIMIFLCCIGIYDHFAYLSV